MSVKEILADLKNYEPYCGTNFAATMREVIVLLERLESEETWSDAAKGHEVYKHLEGTLAGEVLRGAVLGPFAEER